MIKECITLLFSSFLVVYGINAGNLACGIIGVFLMWVVVFKLSYEEYKRSKQNV